MLSQETKKRKEKERTKERERLEKVSMKDGSRSIAYHHHRDKDEYNK